RKAGTGRQRRLRPTAERRLRRGARLDPAAHPPQRAAAAAPLAARAEPGRVREQGLARARPGDLGGAGQAAALRLFEADVLGRARSGGEAGRDPWGRGRTGEVGRGRRRDSRGHPGERRRRPRRPVPALRERGSGRFDAAGRDLRLPAGRRRAPEGERAGDRGGADRPRVRPAVQDRRDRRRPLGQGGDVPDLLVLARLRARYRRRAADGAGPDGAASPGRLAARPLRRGVRRGDGPPPGQLPAGVLAPGADGGRRPDHVARADGATLRWRRSDMESYDVIIVGTGAGGGTLARRLAPSGKRILLLERGDWLPREPSNWLAQDVFVDNRYVSEDTWYDAKGKPFAPQIHYFVGGATKLYGAALYRLREEDFGELQHHDGPSPAWPISYDQLEPYYTQAEQLYEVHGARGEDPTE